MKEYGVNNPKIGIEMFHSLAEAEKYARGNGLDCIDIYDNDPKSLDYQCIIGNLKVQLNRVISGSENAQ